MRFHFNIKFNIRLIKILGVTLKGANSNILWNPDSTSGADELEYPRANKLIIKQILLGVEAKEGEYNVVEVKYGSFYIE